MKKSLWKQIWPYLVFGVTIGVLVFINVIFIQKGVDNSRHNSKTINIAGRQRYLSQHIVTNVIIDSKKGKLNTLAKQEAEKWNEVHFALQRGSEKFGLIQLSSPEIQKQFEKLSPVQHELYELVSGDNLSDTAINRILFLQSAYLPVMDRIVLLFETGAQLDLKKIRENQILVVLISGLILLLEILFLVVPYHRKLIYAFSELQSQKTLIEKQNEAIEKQLYTLSVQNTELDTLHRTEELTLAGINAGVWNWNVATGGEIWSPNFYSLLGYQNNEIPATLETFENILLHPDDVAPVSEAIARHFQHGDQYRLNIRLKNKNGTYKWYESSGMSSTNKDGKAIQMAGSIIDIDEKIAYQKQLELMNQTKDKLFAIIAHDLRTPINSVNSLLTLHDEGVLSQKELFEYFADLKRNFTFLSETLDNMLAWAIGQMSGLKAEPAVIDINEVVKMAERFYHNLCLQKEITLQLELAHDTRVFADLNQVYTIIRNVISNAIKFTPQGGKITVGVSLQGESVKIVIEDTGIGIKQSDIALILQKGKYFTTYGTNNEKGTGLGIGLVLEMLQLNNGTLEIDSEKEKGSRFTITLPAAK